MIRYRKQTKKCKIMLKSIYFEKCEFYKSLTCECSLICKIRLVVAFKWSFRYAVYLIQDRKKKELKSRELRIITFLHSLGKLSNFRSEIIFDIYKY